jgi:hypothetical protein
LACHEIERCKVIAQIDWFDRATTDAIFEQLNRLNGKCNYYICINSIDRGCSENTLRALDRGFEQDDFVVHVEDDVLLYRDSLEMFDHMRRTYRDDESVFTVTAWNSRVNQHHDAMGRELRRNRWFSPWGWATWRDRFEQMRQCWHHSWDIIVNEVARQDRFQVHPTLGRSQNIGSYDATYVPSAEWHAENQHCKAWASGKPGIASQGEWREREWQSVADDRSRH